jgi:hypothetical protein
VIPFEDRPVTQVPTPARSKPVVKIPAKSMGESASDGIIYSHNRPLKRARKRSPIPLRKHSLGGLILVGYTRNEFRAKCRGSPLRGDSIWWNFARRATITQIIEYKGQVWLLRAGITKSTIGLYEIIEVCVKKSRQQSFAPIIRYSPTHRENTAPR